MYRKANALIGINCSCLLGFQRLYWGTCVRRWEDRRIWLMNMCLVWSMCLCRGNETWDLCRAVCVYVFVFLCVFVHVQGRYGFSLFHPDRRAFHFFVLGQKDEWFVFTDALAQLFRMSIFISEYLGSVLFPVWVTHVCGRAPQWSAEMNS